MSDESPALRSLAALAAAADLETAEAIDRLLWQFIASSQTISEKLTALADLPPAPAVLRSLAPDLPERKPKPQAAHLIDHSVWLDLARQDFPLEQRTIDIEQELISRSRLMPASPQKKRSVQ